MRDVERLKEKIEISLDGRQVWALGLFALVLLAGSFTVGLLVGRRTTPLPASAGDLAEMDATARPQASGPRPQAETKAEPPAVVEAPKAAPVEEPPKPQPKPADEKVREAAVVAAPRPAAVVQPVDKRPTKVASTAPVILTTPPRDLGEYTVQIGASQDRAEAQRIEAKARAAGLKPYAVEADLGAKGTWYRVRVGSFHDKDKAAQFRRDVERELRAPAVVMATR